MEVLELEQRKSVLQLELEAATADRKAEIKKLDGEIAALKSAARGSERVVGRLAYRDIDWQAQVCVIRAADNHEELAREPIPRHTQMPIPGTEEQATQQPRDESDPEPVVTPGLAPVREPFPADPKMAVLRASGGVEAHTHESLYARIREIYSDVPEDLAGLLNPVILSLAREHILERLPTKRGDAASFRLVPRPSGSNGDSSDTEEDDEERPEDAAPVAPPKPRGRGRKKAEPAPVAEAR
jgi:hypothetical protein